MDKIQDYGIFNQPPYLLEQFQGTDVQKLLTAIDSQFNDLETAAFSLFTKIWLGEAEGVNLDILGKHLGLSRKGREDEMYVPLLELKSRINTSGGSPEIIIDTIRYLYGANEVHYTSNGPASIEITQDGVMGLLYYSNIQTSNGLTTDALVDNLGEQLSFGEPDDAAVSILDSVIPVGVKLTIEQIQ